MAPWQETLQLTPGKQWVEPTLVPSATVQTHFTFPVADNPFVINGPLHVRVFADAQRLVFEDYLGAVTDPGRFDFRLGLAPGNYRIVARSIWSTSASFELDVGNEELAVTAPLIF